MRNLALALAGAALLVLAFPPAGLSWLAPLALAPLLVAAAREPRHWRRFLWGQAAGVLYWFGACLWIRDVLAVHGGMGAWGAWGVFLLFALGKGLHLAVFCLLAGALMRRRFAAPAVAALWTGLERTHGPLGFTWLALGNAGIDYGIPMRLAPWTGVYGLSFVFALAGAVLALAWLRRPRRELAWVAALVSLYLLPALPATQSGRESAALLQPNIRMDENWTAQARSRMYERAFSLSLRAALDSSQPPAALIAWPESPAPIYYESDPVFREQANQLARAARTPFLFGMVAFTSSGAPLNSAQYVSASGEPLARYDKIHLVPFGEFVPAPFGFVSRITQEAGDFAPGTRVVVAPVGAHRAGAFICYESAFPHLVRRFAEAGAELFVNLSNDGYFGRSAAREQHLLLARMRAAENRRWILRATNDGITAAIDPAGRIAEQWRPYAEHAGRLRFSWVQSMTLYTRYGDWFAWLCLAAGVASVWRRPDYTAR